MEHKLKSPINRKVRVTSFVLNAVHKLYTSTNGQPPTLAVEITVGNKGMTVVLWQGEDFTKHCETSTPKILARVEQLLTEAADRNEL